jgi:hypothetical protein
MRESPGNLDIQVKHHNQQVSTSQLRYLELCVNTGRHIVTLGEINITGVRSDGDLFREIVARYRQLRVPGLRRMFYHPVDVQFVKVCFKLSCGLDC